MVSLIVNPPILQLLVVLAQISQDVVKEVCPE